MGSDSIYRLPFFPRDPTYLMSFFSLTSLTSQNLHKISRTLDLPSPSRWPSVLFEQSVGRTWGCIIVTPSFVCAAHWRRSRAHGKRIDSPLDSLRACNAGRERKKKRTIEKVPVHVIVSRQQRAHCSPGCTLHALFVRVCPTRRASGSER
jgi:hypothetical protein